THTVPTGGLFVWASLPLEYDALEISKVCATKKVVYVPGSTFMVDMDQPCSSFRLNYSCTADDKIVEGIKTLGKVFAGFLQIKN
ncbi:MAG: hypothetical protein IKI29_00435, partial [Clostridia bacterium]|nr:hypothetical protein [Clostridia bacterium]